MNRKEADFWTAQKPYRQIRHAQSAVHVHLRSALLIPASQKSRAIFRQPKRLYKWDSDLPAVRVPREAEVYTSGDLIEIPRRMKEGDLVHVGRHTCKCATQSRRSRRRVIQADQNEIGARRRVLIDQQMNSRSEEH